MQITTVHTLSFSIKCSGNEQQAAAHAIIKGGAQTIGLTVNVSAMPLPAGEDSLIRTSLIQAQCDNHDKCEMYWVEVQRALALIGVEATSP